MTKPRQLQEIKARAFGFAPPWLGDLELIPACDYVKKPDNHRHKMSSKTFGLHGRCNY